MNLSVQNSPYRHSSNCTCLIKWRFVVTAVNETTHARNIIQELKTKCIYLTVSINPTDGYNGKQQRSNCCSWQHQTANKGDEHQLPIDVHPHPNPVTPLHVYGKLDQLQHTRSRDEAEVYLQFLVLGFYRLDKHHTSDNTLCTRRHVHMGLTHSAQIVHNSSSLWLHDNAQSLPHYTAL